MSSGRHAAGCCVYEVDQQVVFMSMFSPHHLTLMAVPPSDGPVLEAGLVVPVRLPFTTLKPPGSVGRGERLTWRAPMVETLPRNWRPLCRASCLVGQLSMQLFRS